MTRAVPWNSMEFHGTSSAPISLTSAVPRNSMEFHGTWSAPISMTRAVPWNSMEFRGIWSAPISMTRAVPWHSMELGVCQFRWQHQFHGIPWNFKCAKFADTSSSMEFHGTRSAQIAMTRTVLWMEFDWIPWNFKCANFDDTSSSMEFNGIPWNQECANFYDTGSSMEFHGNWSAPISMTRAVPWNSMELQMRQFRWHEQFHGIPWNFKGANFADISRIPWNLECVNFDDTSSFMEFHGTRSAPISMTRAVP